MGAAIEVRNLTKRFGATTALDSVSLDIDPSEFLVLLGPSGCGKTTLLRCLAGLETPDEGEISIAGNLVFSAERGISVPPGKRQLGMVFQSYALWPHMTVYDNIGFGLGIQKVPRTQIKERVDRVLQDLAMSGLGERYPSELSGGQQQRVAVARLLATKPPVFLMDEPLSNLDARLRVDMRTELKRLHFNSDATTVFVTHDQSEAMTLASLIVVMNHGQIEQRAAPLDLYRQPESLFVAEFVGMPRINLVSAESVRENGLAWANVDDFRIPLSGEPPQGRLTIAARPEDITLSLEPQGEAIEFKVYATLSSGPETMVQAVRGTTTIVVRASPQLDVKMDQPVWLTFDRSAINLYDERSGKLMRVSERTQPAAFQQQNDFELKPSNRGGSS